MRLPHQHWPHLSRIHPWYHPRLLHYPEVLKRGRVSLEKNTQTHKHSRNTDTTKTRPLKINPQPLRTQG